MGSTGIERVDTVMVNLTVWVKLTLEPLKQEFITRYESDKDYNNILYCT